MPAANWIRVGNKILKQGTAIAIDLDCCCECCSCAWLQSEYGLNQQLKVTISGGGLSGVCFLEATALTGTSCANWLTIPLTCVPTDICVYNLQQMFFVCNGPTVQFETGLSNMGCDMTDAVGDPTPLNFAAHAKYPVSSSCTPTSYTARFEFPIADGIPGGCGGCDPGPIVFIVETV